MDKFISPIERRSLWQALSYEFVDNKIQYDYITREVAQHDIKTIEAIFFGEVASACYPNRIAVIPPVWTFFEDEWLDEEIPALLSKSKRNPYQRLRYKIYVSYLRWACKDIWSAITDELQKMEGSA